MRVLLRFTLSLAALALLAAAPAWPAERPLADQVVRISVTYQRFDERLPWSRSGVRGRRASGVIVAGPFILTTAQMVGDATFIEVEKHGGPVRVPAHVHHVDADINLALLAVDEPGFFDGLLPAIPAGELPPGAVLTLARWEGGQLETAASRVARVQVDSGPTSDREHLFYRVKSDLPGGGWADPVFAGDRLLGLTVAQNGGEEALVMPAEIIAAYLEAAREPGPYRGFARLHLGWQENRSSALSSWLGLAGEPRGVLVQRVPWGATGSGALQPRDLLLAIDGHEIAADGFYRHPRHGRLKFANIAVEGHRAGDIVTATVLRAGKVVDLPLELRRYTALARLVPWSPPGRRPPYRIAGGLVFRELDRNYLAAAGKEWRQEADARLLMHLELDAHDQRPGRRRIVVLSSVLPSAYSIGYHDLQDLPVRAVNGVPVGSLADLDEGFRHPREGLHTVSFAPNPTTDEVVLDADGMARADEELLANFRISQAAWLDPEPPPDLGPAPPATP